MNANCRLNLRFSAAAATYEQRAALQDMVAQRLCELLRAEPLPAKILEIGCGTGLLTRRLVRDFPEAKIDAIDLSSGMLARAQANMGGRDGPAWHEGDFMAVNLTGFYSLIVSSSALHWIRPLSALAARIHALLSPGGRFAAAVMVRGTLAELRLARRHVARKKLPFALLPAMSELRCAFFQAGLQIERVCRAPMEVVYPSAAVFLRLLHEQGLTADPNAQGARNLLSRKELARLIVFYDRCFTALRINSGNKTRVPTLSPWPPACCEPRGRQATKVAAKVRIGSDSGVYATYQVCYLAARKPA